MDNQKEFCKNLILHIAQILVEEVPSLPCFRSNLATFEDLREIMPHKTEEYYLPTFNQEEGLTQGNMIVLRHYILNVLALPKNVFERVMFLILGDRLTTARDQAAQNQRAVD